LSFRRAGSQAVAADATLGMKRCSIRSWPLLPAADKEQMMSRDRIEDDSLESRAERRVRRKMGFYIHAFVFVAVNLGLYAINSVAGEPRWSHFPLWGWGLGLAIHGLVTFIALQGDGVRRGMLAREIEHLRRTER
jgi:2TM domain